LKLVLDQQIYRFGRNPEKIIYHKKNEGLIIATMLEIVQVHSYDTCSFNLLNFQLF